MKVVITIEEGKDGGVLISSDPPLTELHATCESPTPAHGYALNAWAALRWTALESARERGETLPPWL